MKRHCLGTYELCLQRVEGEAAHVFHSTVKHLSTGWDPRQRKATSEARVEEGWGGGGGYRLTIDTAGGVISIGKEEGRLIGAADGTALADWVL